MKVKLKRNFYAGYGVTYKGGVHANHEAVEVPDELYGKLPSDAEIIGDPEKVQTRFHDGLRARYGTKPEDAVEEKDPSAAFQRQLAEENKDGAGEHGPIEESGAQHEAHSAAARSTRKRS